MSEVRPLGRAHFIRAGEIKKASTEPYDNRHWHTTRPLRNPLATWRGREGGIYLAEDTRHGRSDVVLIKDFR